jgi:uncharacterized membrane protein required for colicin V production
MFYWPGKAWKIEKAMSFDKLPFNWFDLVMLAVLITGILRGRKRGMSEELMTLLQWIAIVVAAAFAYKPLGDFMEDLMPLSKLSCYILAYALSAGLVALIFVLIKRFTNGKLIGSDVFGKSEYYLGMPAGMVRFFCILLAILSVLNARLFTQEEIRARHEYQMKNYDNEFFPGMAAIQANVFEKSLSGPFIKKQLGFLLIKPTISQNKEIKRREFNMP